MYHETKYFCIHSDIGLTVLNNLLDSMCLLYFITKKSLKHAKPLFILPSGRQITFCAQTNQKVKELFSYINIYIFDKRPVVKKL
jgi:hypothetical protein